MPGLKVSKAGPSAFADHKRLFYNIVKSPQQQIQSGYASYTYNLQSGYRICICDLNPTNSTFFRFFCAFGRK